MLMKLIIIIKWSFPACGAVRGRTGFYDYTTTFWDTLSTIRIFIRPRTHVKRSLRVYEWITVAGTTAAVKRPINEINLERAMKLALSFFTFIYSMTIHVTCTGVRNAGLYKNHCICFRLTEIEILYRMSSLYHATNPDWDSQSTEH